MRQLTLDEAATLLGVSRRTVQRRLSDGTLTGRKQAGRWLVNVPDVPADTRTAQIATTLSHQVEVLRQERDAQRESLRELAQRVQRLETNKVVIDVPVEAEAEVIEAVSATLAAWNGGDVAAFLSHFHPNANGFFLDGDLLRPALNGDHLENAYDAGFKPNMTVQHVKVKVHDGCAIVTGYLLGTLATPNDSDLVGTWRFSEVRINDEGRWKILHYHFSLLTPGFVQRSP